MTRTRSRTRTAPTPRSSARRSGPLPSLVRRATDRAGGCVVRRRSPHHVARHGGAVVALSNGHPSGTAWAQSAAGVVSFHPAGVGRGSRLRASVRRPRERVPRSGGAEERRAAPARFDAALVAAPQPGPARARGAAPDVRGAATQVRSSGPEGPPSRARSRHAHHEHHDWHPVERASHRGGRGAPGRHARRVPHLPLRPALPDHP